MIMNPNKIFISIEYIRIFTHDNQLSLSKIPKKEITTYILLLNEDFIADIILGSIFFNFLFVFVMFSFLLICPWDIPGSAELKTCITPLHVLKIVYFVSLFTPRKNPVCYQNITEAYSSRNHDKNDYIGKLSILIF